MAKQQPTHPKGNPQPRSATPPKREGTLARRLALEAILETDGGRNCFIDEALEPRLLRPELSDEKDHRLLQEIAYGTLRHRNTLDALLDDYVHFAMKRQRPAVRWALRLGAYQLVYLGRIPAHAAIDRTISAFKGIPDMAERDAGFLNAVLRRLAGDILRKSESAALDPDDPTVLPIRSGACHFRRPILPIIRLDPVSHIALKHSHPKWLVVRWLARFGAEEAAALCASQNRIPHLAARITSRAQDREAAIGSIQAQGVVVAPLAGTDSILLRRTGDPRNLEALAKGWILIQDPTATAIGAALAPPPDARVLDLCASPGAKAVQLLEALGPGGSLLACDVDDAKCVRLRQNLEKAGGNFQVRTVPDEPEAIELGGTFTHILLDVPCSNTGVLARRPEARWRLRWEDLGSLTDLQRKLLAAAVRHLAPGGRLVYATCSIEPEENQDMAAWAVREFPGLQLLSERLFLPHKEPGDGGYCAVMVKSSA